MLLSCSAYGQFTYTFDQSIPVEENGKVLSMPRAGGVNSAQINTTDLNGDNKDDLVVFDRTSNKILTYLRVGNRYEYAPEYESLFPVEVTQWLLLRDLNCDGKKICLRAIRLAWWLSLTPPNHSKNFRGDRMIWTSYFNQRFPS